MRERDWEQQPFLIPRAELKAYRETLCKIISRERQEAACGTEERHSDWRRLRAGECHISLSKEEREEENMTKKEELNIGRAELKRKGQWKDGNKESY